MGEWGAKSVITALGIDCGVYEKRFSLPKIGLLKSFCVSVTEQFPVTFGVCNTISYLKGMICLTWVVVKSFER